MNFVSLTSIYKAICVFTGFILTIYLILYLMSIVDGSQSAASRRPNALVQGGRGRGFTAQKRPQSVRQGSATSISADHVNVEVAGDGGGFDE